MYDIEFEASGNILRLCYETGIYVGSISGLTGVTSSFKTVQNSSGAGASIVGSSTGSKAVTIKGYVLDGQTAVKQSILDFFKPGHNVTMYINSRRTTTDTQRAYQAQVAVKASPTFTQETHSKFVIELLMPIPYWSATNEYIVPMGETYSVLGDAEPEFDLTFKIAQNNVLLVALWATDPVELTRKIFSISTTGGSGYPEIGDIIHIWRDNGIIRASLNGVEKMAMLFAESDLWYLPLGSQIFSMTNANDVSDVVLKYRPMYSGVLVDGV